MKILILISAFLLFCVDVSAQFNFQRTWGTYFGDERFFFADSKADSAGNLYIAGFVDGRLNTNFPEFTTASSYQPAYGGGDSDGFLAKFDAEGNLIWATYFGGDQDDKMRGLEIDGQDNLYILGWTFSESNIATPGSYQSAYGGNGDYFLTKFNSTGALIWSTYFGGSGEDYEYSFTVPTAKISFDGDQSLYISGTASSENLATPGVFQETLGNSDSQISKFDLNGNRIWTTYYGLNTFIGYLKSNGNAVYCSGVTLDCPPNHPYNTYYGTPNGFQPLPNSCWEIFLSKFDPQGQRVWSTYYGGNSNETATDMAIALKEDKVFLSGTARNYQNQEITTPGTYQPSCTQISNFIAQFNQNGTRNWGTYNGILTQIAQGYLQSSVLASSDPEAFYNFGATYLQQNIATEDGYLSQPNNVNSGDAFICKFTNQNTKEWGTYYGGELNEQETHFMPYDGENKFYIVGNTQSLTQIATVGSFQETKQVIDLENNTFQNAYNIYIAHFEKVPLSTNTFTKTNFTIFPNPTDGIFSIFSRNATSRYSIEFWDVLGKKLFSEKVSGNTPLNLENLAKGVYCLKITDEDNNTEIKKIVVK
jgi:hypothetical protein